MFVKMYAPVDEDTHRKLTELAVDRRIPLYQLLQAIMIWAGDRSAQDLIGLGVNLPVYANELGPQPGKNSK